MELPAPPPPPAQLGLSLQPHTDPRRTPLVPADESEFEDFFADVEMDESFLRGFMAGLVQSIMIERAHGENIGRLSHAEFVELYDAACAFLMESSV